MKQIQALANHINLILDILNDTPKDQLDTQDEVLKARCEFWLKHYYEIYGDNNRTDPNVGEPALRPDNGATE